MNEMCKKLTQAFLCLLMLGLLFSAGADAEGNLLVNGDFSLIDSAQLPAAWFTDAYVSAEGYTVFSASQEDGTPVICVNNIGLNDARFAQRVHVEPNSLYKLSGDIRAEGIEDQGWGANLSVYGVYAYSDAFFDTQGEWKHVEYYGQTGPEQDELTVYARVGGYSGESIGKAWFRNLSLVQVEAVPGGETADRWYRTSNSSSTKQETEQAETAAPVWPWLIAISAAYIAAGLLMMRWLGTRKASQRRRQRAPWWLWAGLVLAFVIRVALSLSVAGYSVDVNCFSSWGGRMATGGPRTFYQEGYFCDYPPAYMLVLGLNGLLSGAMPAGAVIGVVPVQVFINTLLPMLCDIGIACFVYLVAQSVTISRGAYMSREQAAAFSLLVAFNPLLVLNSACWKQIDSVLALLLMLVAWLAIKKQWQWLMPVYILSVLVKPQALMLGPLGLGVLVLEWVKNKNSHRDMLLGIAWSALTALVIILPFGLGQTHFGWLIEIYQSTLSSYGYATVNTANLYYLVGANWQPVEQTAHIAVPLALAALSAAWGVWCAFAMRCEGEKLRVTHPECMLMALFIVFFALTAILRLGWQWVGYGAIAFAFAVVLPLLFRSQKIEHLPLLGGVLFLLLYVLSVKMHERYLFPAIAFFAMAYALRRDWRTLVLLLATSVTVFINEGIPLDNSIRLGATMGHLNSDTAWLASILSAANLACVPLALWLCSDICMAKQAETLREQEENEDGSARRDPAGFNADPSLHWKRLDTVLCIGLTVIYAVVGFWNLGSVRAPQNAWTSTTANEQVVLDLGQHFNNFSMTYFCRVSYHDFTVAVSDDGENWSEEYWAQMKQGNCYRWMYLMPSVESEGSRTYTGGNSYEEVQKLSGRYVRITAQQINLNLCEVLFFETEAVEQTWTDAAGEHTETVLQAGRQLIPAFVAQYNMNEESTLVSSGANLIDEQDTMEGQPGWYNSTYFDEIYHARTAYEHAHGTVPYETTHPPLGKVIMSWFVSLFGMTPFGWRFAGCLMGVLMVPAMYLLGKQLTKKTGLAFTAAALMSLDCMHFTQTRIATIDSFAVLFIILGFLFMLRFLQRDIVAEPICRVLPDLALSGFFMGCAVASKWIGVYAGCGLAVLFFWNCVRHLRLASSARTALKDKNRAEQERAALLERANGTTKRLIMLCAWCLLFFLAVPLLVYLLSYIPYFRYMHTSSLGEWLRLVIDAQEGMLSYHSTPGLGMDHPFYSPWHEWPIIARPMYYASAHYMPKGYSMALFCFGNPAVWLVGLAGLAFTLIKWASGHLYRLKGNDFLLHADRPDWDVSAAFVLIGFLAQFLPWMLVPRGTYIYHYFASVPFLILSTVLLLEMVSRRWPAVGKAIVIVYLVVCLVFFIAWYPYASGITAPYAWLDFMKKFLHVYYSV